MIITLQYTGASNHHTLNLLNVIYCTAVLSHFSHVWLFVTPWTVPCQASPSMGFSKARILEWVAMPSSRGSSPLRDGTQVSYVSYIGRRVLGKPMLYIALCQKRCFKKQVSEEEAELEKWTYPLRCCSEVGFYQVLGKFPSGSGH